MFGAKKESWLIVGLGNPGREYEKTRHNVGFRAVDMLAQKLDCKIDKAKFQGLYGQVNYNGGKLFLLKPQTFMNLSGRSVLQLSFSASISTARKPTLCRVFSYSLPGLPNPTISQLSFFAPNTA